MYDVSVSYLLYIIQQPLLREKNLVSISEYKD
jgi:hypothetical protein